VFVHVPGMDGDIHACVVEVPHANAVMLAK
jgi:hypothetical protein